MRREQKILAAASILLYIAVPVLLVSRDFTYWTLLMVLSLAANIAFHLHSKSLFEKCHRIGESLFTQQFGTKPDRVEYIQTPPGKYDCLEVGITGRGLQIGFWLNGKALKGIVDIDEKILYMKPLIWMPVYTHDLMAVWRNTPEMHGNGMPKKVEFRDSNEVLQRIDYLDQKGILKRGTWRRYKGIEQYWNPGNETWEPVP
ncbi:MAG: hypothetical protein HXS41_00805 [Theionarchaea archaeon]|nr:hypothetical protein [Theionarchaea archaeon]MBU6999308.1 hypothetical protein [Theionarchaea archaeon]MBU7019567.1 hypothetical protein [Theionarchaea archaeon]MBU7033746.1 hypothetical protein [Theionarchaea archaeon]MBU7039444.1 hypothetical protein [Theionarchaea archaeon]